MALVSIHSSGICSIYGRHLFTRILFWRRLGRHGCATGTRYMNFEMHVRPDVQVYECRPKLFWRVALSTLSFPAPSMTPALFSHICIGWCTQHNTRQPSHQRQQFHLEFLAAAFFSSEGQWNIAPRLEIQTITTVHPIAHFHPPLWQIYANAIGSIESNQHKSN